MSNVQTYSHNLIVLDYTARPDGKVAIRFAIMSMGIYYNLRFASKAFPPGDTNGIVMTPALGDPQHSQDPLIVTGPGQVFTFVWDAPADGFTSINLSGWTVFVGYLNLFCCESDEPSPRPPEEDGDAPSTDPEDMPETPDTSEPTVPPAPAAPGDIPTAGGGEGSNSPILPGPGTIYNPAPGGYVRPPILAEQVGPVIAGQLGDEGRVPNYGYRSDPDAGGYNLVNGRYVDAFGNPVYATDPTPTPVIFVPGPSSTPLISAATETANFPTTDRAQLTPSPSTPQGTQQTDLSQFGNQGNLATSPTVATVSASIYTLPSDDGQFKIVAEMYPSISPQDVGSTVFVSVTNRSDATVDGLYLYVEGLDSGGNRLLLSAQQTLGPLPAFGANGLSICTSWMSFLTGPVTIAVVLMGPGGLPLVSTTLAGTVTPPGTMPQSPTAVPELPTSVRDAAWGAGAADIQPVFEGSYNALGDEDCYSILTVNSRVGIVVKITADAKLTGFIPVLKIFHPDDLDTPVVTVENRFDVPDADKTSHSIGWRDFAQLPILQVGQEYILQVVHKYPFYSRRWGFKIYTKETVAPVVTSFTISGGNLAGTMDVPGYGRQSIKIVNDRTHDILFVRTDPYGYVSDIQTYTSPSGDRLAVRSGDRLRLYRPGIGVQYRHVDLLKTVTV